MPLIRGHHQHDQYAAIPNQWLRDKRLSLKAIGLLAQIHTHQVGWSLSIHGLALANEVSRDQITSAIKELERYGYLKRTQTVDEQSKRFQEATWTTTDPIPHGEKPLPEKPATEKPVTENQTAKKTISKENHLKEKQTKNIYNDDFESFWKSYPRKENKPKAAKEFAKLSDETDAIMSALTIWLNHPDKRDRQYWPYAERWLRDRRFDDELPSASGLDKSKILGWFE
jgi:hypothetical protein